MPSKSHVHVVGKEDNSEHHVASVSTSCLPPPADGHVRVRSALIALTSNNMSYARMGTLLHWWDAYPVPAALPVPYNDQSRYGVCPVWGYGEVLESSIQDIQAGMVLWGFWPSSDLPVDLKLVPADLRGHWIEISEHRQTMMNLYNRYMLSDPKVRMKSLDKAALKKMALHAICHVQEAGYLLNRAVFGSPPVHPAASGQWSEDDADLSSAVVISLSASGKTARGFTDALINHRSAGTGPLGLLAITSTARDDLVPKAAFPTAVVSYQTATDPETLSWVALQRCRKIVIADFGGRGDSCVQLHEALQKRFPDINLLTIGVGAEAKAYTLEDLGKIAQRNAMPNRFRMNTSPLRDALMNKLGVAAYFKEVEEAWDKFLKGGNVNDLRLEIGQGVGGTNGFEGGWSKYCEGSVAGDAAMAYRMF